MKEKTKDWLKVIVSMLSFNIVIGLFLIYFEIVSAYT